jgi:nucleotide-binding universal stress UspA family protein
MANAAVGPAAELARKTGAKLIVLQVGTAGLGAPAERGSLTMPLYVDQPQHEWPSWTGELLDRLACLCPEHELPAQFYARGGEPGPEIAAVAAAESADLIVLAWKGEWAGERARVLKAILREAPCPIMIVHA